MNLTENTVKRNYIYHGKILSLRCDDVRLPDGSEAKREIVEHPGGAAVLCVWEGKAVLVRQFRYAYHEEILEIPAGKLEKGEDPAAAAVREFEEETGLRADVKHLLTLYPTPGYTEEKIYIYEAVHVAKSAPRLDEGEFLNVEYVPVGDALAMIRDGIIKDAKTIAALLLYQARQKG